MQAVFPTLDAATYPRHALHDPARAWPETNCHTDLFVELLHTLGREPLAGLGMTVAQDFEGDQFTFFKMPTRDIETLFGLDIQELSIYRPLVDHIEEQVARGRIALVEVDAHRLPDTRGVTYLTDHSKTTIAVNRFDQASASLGYFHNAGYFEMTGDDVEHLLGFGSVARPVLPPYVEFVKVAGPGLSGRALRDAAVARFRRPLGEPPDAQSRRFLSECFAGSSRLAGDRAALLVPPLCLQHGTPVRCLHVAVGAHLDWLAGEDISGLGQAVELCERMSAGMKTFQFLLARALARKKTDGLDPALDAVARDYDRAMAEIGRAFGFTETRAPTLVRAAS